MLKRNLLANYLGQGWTALMGLLFLPLYIKLLGIESYGLIGLFAMLQAWLGLLDMGMTPTLNREMARFSGGSHTAESIRDLLRSIEIIAAGIATLIAVGIALGSNWLASSWLKAERLPVGEVAEAFAIMGVVTALRFIEGIYRSCIVGLQKQVLFNIFSSAMATMRALGAVGVLMYVDASIQAFFLWQGVISIVTLVIFAIATYASLPHTTRAGRFCLAQLRSIWRFAGGMIGIILLSLVLTQVDKVLLSKMLSLSDYGYYTLAAVVAGTIGLLLSPIIQAWFPRLSQLYETGDHANLVFTFHQGAQLVSIVLGSAAFVLMVFADTFLQLWTQDLELAQRVAPLLRLMVLGNLLNGLMWIPYQTQLAHGWTSLSVHTNIVAVLFIVPAIIWITPRYGAMGAAWVWVALNAGYLLIGVHFMYRKILREEKWTWYWHDIAQPLLGALIVSLAINTIAKPTSSINQAITLITASIATLASAAFSSHLIRKKIVSTVARHLLAKKIKV